MKRNPSTPDERDEIRVVLAPYFEPHESGLVDACPDLRKALEYARQQGEAAAAPSPSTPRNASKLGRTGDALLLEAKQQRVERCRQLASDINQHLDHGEDFDDPDQSRRLRRLSWLLGDDRALEFVELLREGDVSEVAL